MHSDYFESMNSKVKELYWPRAAGKTSAMKTFMGMDIAINDSIGVNQLVMMDGDGKIRVIMGEQDMCYEGEQRPSYREIELAEANKELKKNHLGAATERFIELAREGGRSEHLGNKVREQDQKIYDLSQALMRANEQVAYSDNETQKANDRARGWEQRAYKAERLYYNLVEKNKKAKKTVKKPVAKKK